MSKKIMIVDDSKTSRLFIRQAMEMIGFQDAAFSEAAHGLEALAHLRAHPCDLLVTDINMPEMGGVELIAAIRADTLLQDIKVFVISSTKNAMREDALKGMGVLGVLQKPISMPQLAAAFAVAGDK